MDLPAFWAHLKKELAGSGILVQGSLSAEELEEIENLKRTKYDTWEWNYGRSPQHEMRNKRRFDGGTMEVFMTAKHGVIQEIAFYGDFLSQRPLDELRAAKIGRITLDAIEREGAEC